MVVRFRKKSRKLRGRTRTMGWGRIGQHRKKGSKGGRGAAGMLKHKESWMRKYAPGWIGKHGFTNPTSKTESISEINLMQLDELIIELRKANALQMEGDIPVIDLRALGFNKLLGKGQLGTAAKIIVDMASKKAVEKVLKAGGQVVVLEKTESE